MSFAWRTSSYVAHSTLLGSCTSMMGKCSLCFFPFLFCSERGGGAVGSFINTDGNILVVILKLVALHTQSLVVSIAAGISPPPPPPSPKPE